MHGAVLVAGAVFLTGLQQVPPDIRAAVVAGFGVFGVTYFAVHAFGALFVLDQGQPWVEQLRVFPALTFTAWVVIGVTQVPEADAYWVSYGVYYGIAVGMMALIVELLGAAILGKEPPAIRPTVRRYLSRARTLRDQNAPGNPRLRGRP
jgi:hypothetical protein